MAEASIYEPVQGELAYLFDRLWGPSPSAWLGMTTRFAAITFRVRYLVKARVKAGSEKPLIDAIERGTLGKGSIAGDEYQHNMQQARVDPAGVATWVETCFCDPPLEEERPYWEKYFELLSVKDAHSRRNCRHENGSEPWACGDCDCTVKLEAKLAGQGEAFLAKLGASSS